MDVAATRGRSRLLDQKIKGMLEAKERSAHTSQRQSQWSDNHERSTPEDAAASGACLQSHDLLDVTNHSDAFPKELSPYPKFPHQFTPRPFVEPKIDPASGRYQSECSASCSREQIEDEPEEGA